MNIRAKLEEVEQEYLQRLTGDGSGLLGEVERYLAAVPGKFLRPHLLLAAASTLGEECFHSRRTLLLAVAVEMLHNASLLHDDVIDRAASRRGRPSVNHRWSPAVAVLVGDHLLAQTMQLVHESNDSEASALISRTVTAMVEAELLALDASAPQDEQRYLRIIDGKTASLFSTACALGNPAYEEFGLHYGRLFQLADDEADDEATSFTVSLAARERDALLSLDISLPDIPYPASL